MLEIVYIVIIFGLTVLVHELGHFLAAKAIGVRVEKFSLGWGDKMVSFKHGETEYMISWLVFLGGYVKLAGEDPSTIDPADSRAFLNQPPAKKIFLSVAGVFMNFVFAVVLMYIVLISGMETLKPVVGEAKEGYPAAEAGIMKGDIVTGIDGQKIRYWNELSDIVKKNTGTEMAVTVLRDGKELTFRATPAMEETEDLLKQKVKRPFLGITPLTHVPVIDELAENRPAIKAGFKKGDEITAVNGKKTEYWDEVVGAIRASKGKEMSIQVKRDGKLFDIKVAALLFETGAEGGKEYMIGISPKLNTIPERYGPARSAGLAFEKTVFFTDLTLRALYRMITGKMEADVAGPVGVMTMTYKVAKTGFINLLMIFVIINVNLALVNLLPIVPLDGGLVLLFLTEAVIGRPVPQKVQEALMQAGWMFIIFLLVFFTYKDILRLIKGG